MQKFFTFFRSALSFVLVLILNEAIGQCPNYPSMRQTFHTVDIGTYVKGYLEYLPPDYNSNTPHPLIIYFHGAGEVGNGTPSSLCNLLTAANTFDIPFPERIVIHVLHFLQGSNTCFTCQVKVATCCTR